MILHIYRSLLVLWHWHWHHIQKRPILLWRSQMNRDHILPIITFVPLQNDRTSNLEGKNVRTCLL